MIVRAEHAVCIAAGRTADYGNYNMSAAGPHCVCMCVVLTVGNCFSPTSLCCGWNCSKLFGTTTTTTHAQSLSVSTGPSFHPTTRAIFTFAGIIANCIPQCVAQSAARIPSACNRRQWYSQSLFLHRRRLTVFTCCSLIRICWCGIITVLIDVTVSSIKKSPLRWMFNRRG